MPSFNTLAWAVAGVIALVVLYILHQFDEKASNNWELIARGVYDRVVYGYYKETRSSGMGNRRIHKMDVTVIHFKDGTTCIIDGRYDVIFPRGTKIYISQNGHGEYRFKKTR